MRTFAGFLLAFVVVIARSVSCRALSCGERLVNRISPLTSTRATTIHFTAARIVRARSTTMSDVTCFMQA